MSMSKKNYESFAKIINNYVGNNLVDIPVDVLINDLCNYFVSDNPNFNGERFFDACKKEN